MILLGCRQTACGSDSDEGKLLLGDLDNEEVLLFPSSRGIGEALEDAEVVVDVHDALPTLALDAKRDRKSTHLDGAAGHLEKRDTG
jgi:hypothetical protein